MTWYAVKTTPGSQKPQREYAVEKIAGNRSKKGYRIIPSLNPNVSAVERALTLNGFSHYMPAEKRLIRDRRHTDLWKVRRFALMVGYIFVQDPRDWELLKDTPGVDGVVATAGGDPYPIDILDIMAIRGAEAETEGEFDRQSVKARQNARKRAKRDPRLQMLIGKLDIAGTITFSMDNDVAAA